MSAALEPGAPVAPAERGVDRFIAALSLRRVVVAIVLAVLAAAALNPSFVTPFPVLLGRMLVIALLLLLVFTAAGTWAMGGAPRWLVQVVAVVLAAPLATYLVYLPSVNGRVRGAQARGTTVGLPADQRHGAGRRAAARARCAVPRA
ncbi:hypothetical protein FSC37_11700 [Piscinibacter aquaticus]|uniref:Uncharacterized protein n=1 Tax=Piscinibacter aquaticus TaxID=392597 RepID=A0A5C6U3S5_9BURK|nr:hypothetical protein FSC37_11700 [Piscinibacter aquaticus]